LRYTRLEDVLPLDDRLVRLDPTDHVVRLHGQDLLQRVRRAVGLERPHLHLAEALPTKLRLAAQRLLGDQAVGTRRPGADLVLHQVHQLQHVDVADRPLLVELLARPPVAQLDLAALRRPARFSSFLMSASLAPSNTGVANFSPSWSAAQPR